MAKDAIMIFRENIRPEWEEIEKHCGLLLLSSGPVLSSGVLIIGVFRIKYLFGDFFSHKPFSRKELTNTWDLRPIGD